MACGVISGGPEGAGCFLATGSGTAAGAGAGAEGAKAAAVAVAAEPMATGCGDRGSGGGATLTPGPLSARLAGRGSVEDGGAFKSARKSGGAESAPGDLSSFGGP